MIEQMANEELINLAGLNNEGALQGLIGIYKE
jgi:hypothetical protein